MVPAVSCYDVEFKHGIIPKILKVPAQGENRGPRTTNNSPVISYWPLNKCNLDIWEKTALSTIKTRQSNYARGKKPQTKMNSQAIG